MDHQTLLRPARADPGGADGEPHLLRDRTASSDLMIAVLRLAEAWRSRLTADFAQFRLNDARFAVLQAVEDAGDAGCSQTELARRLRNSESNISTLLNRMVSDNLVERRRSQTDRRKSLIRLSPNGAARLARARDQYRRAADDLLAGWPPSQCRKLIHQLTQLRDMLDAERDEPYFRGSPAIKQDAATTRTAPLLSQHPGTQSRLP